MADSSQRQRLRELVGELHSCVEIRDLDAATDVLASSVTSRNIANVTALTNKRKLSERSADPPKVDALYAELKGSGNQPVTDRFINVLLKLREAPELMAVIADPAAAQMQAEAAMAPAPAPAPASAPLSGSEAHQLLGARLAGRCRKARARAPARRAWRPVRHRRRRASAHSEDSSRRNRRARPQLQRRANRGYPPLSPRQRRCGTGRAGARRWAA